MNSQFSNVICALMLSGSMLYACRRTAPTDPSPNGHSATADTIASHLRFSNAKKITGAIPKGPASSSLKISIADTLYLVDKWKLPVKFLHEDTAKNVVGAYIQVLSGGSGGTFYYDVPEVPDIASNDSVSVILAGIDPNGLIDTSGVPPAGSPPFEIVIIPHDPNGQPLGETIVPVHISTPQTDPPGKCGLVTKEGEYWEWSMSFIPDVNNPAGDDIFFNTPNKLWGLRGQLIQGCCTNGVSGYTANCAEGDKKSLNFQTFFGWPNEIYKFFEDGTYAGLSEFINAEPDPHASNFCGTGPGVVKEDFGRYFLEGTWTIDPSMYLTTVGTSTPQAGSLAARPLGIIDVVGCRLLIVVEPDRERGGRDLVKFYIRKNSSSPGWFPI